MRVRGDIRSHGDSDGSGARLLSSGSSAVVCGSNGDERAEGSGELHVDCLGRCFVD
jgi:hypothetical protein